MSDSITTKTVAAQCPTGKRVVGGGGSVAGGGGQVVIERLQPAHLATGDRFIAGAREDPTGYAGQWSLTAFALCAEALPGQQILNGSTPTSTDGLQSVLAFCPAGQDQVGFGGRINNGAGQIYTSDLYPSFIPPPTGTFMRARKGAVGSTTWSLSAYTVCASSEVAAGFSTVASTSPSSSVSKSATLTCPPGSQVHSAGFQLASGIGLPDHVFVDRVSIGSELAGATIRAVEDEAGTSQAWTVRALALCAP